METQEVLDPQRWAANTFGSAQLKDRRRTRRAIMAATQMARDASASLPHQMQTWKDVKALYRLLDESDVTFEALIQPHCQQTRAGAEAEAVVLLVQDTTELDLSHRAKLSGIGQIGNAKGRGILLQTVLAVVPETRAILGCIAQKPFVRVPAPQKEQRYQRRHREQRETDGWMEMVQQIGTLGPASMVVHGGDRGADMFPFFRSCLSTQSHFVVRAAQNRRIESGEQEIDHLLDQVRAWSSQGQRPFWVPASHGRTSRETKLEISGCRKPAFCPLGMIHEAAKNHCPCGWFGSGRWGGQREKSHWNGSYSLLDESSTNEQAWQCVDWYRCRWIGEDYHQCLKTGCRIEERQVQNADRLMRLLGLLSPVAVRLLQLRAFSQETPDRLASQVLDAEVVALIAARTTQSPSMLTIKAFWTEVARMGGYLNRRGDGPPGWKTLWKGWLQLQTLLEGVHLAPLLLL